MKIFVEDKFNPRAFGGWFLLPLYIIFCLLFDSSDAFVLIATMSFIMILAASLIGETYRLSLFTMAAIFTLINFLFIGFEYVSLKEGITIIFAAIASLVISFTIVSYYKRALNFFNRKAFWLDTAKITPEDRALRNRLWVIFYVAIFIATIALIAHFPFTGHAPEADAMIFFPFISLLGTISALLVGYGRNYGIIMLSAFFSISLFPVLGLWAIFAIIPNAIAISIGVWIVIGYYGNTNKISIEKVAAYVFKHCKRKRMMEENNEN